MVMAFKTQPIGAIASMGIDWSGVANRVANELGADGYRVSFLYGSPRPSDALNPLAAQRARYAFERLGVGGALPVLSFFGSRVTWIDASETVIRALGHESTEEWSSVLDENDNPIRVISHNGSKLCFAINVYGPTLTDLESRAVAGGSDSDDAEAVENAETDDPSDGGNENNDMDLEFDD
jgi:hypothetical protein